MGQSDQLANCMERDLRILGASLDRQIAAGAGLDQLVAIKGRQVNEGRRQLRREPVPVFPVLQEQSGPEPKGQSQPGGRQAMGHGTGAIGAADQGHSVSLSDDGNTAIVGGVDDNGGAGAAWVYTRSDGVWNQQAKLVGTGAVGPVPAAQGFSVAFSGDGNTAIVGGTNDNSLVGAAWVFVRSASGVWSQQGAKLVGTPALGENRQGNSVSLPEMGIASLWAATWTAIVSAPPGCGRALAGYGDP